MKKFMTIAAFAALAFAACGDSSSDSLPTDGNPNDALFGSPWVSTSTPEDTESEVIKFERTGVQNFVKVTKYVTCNNNRFSIVEADIKIGSRALDIQKDVAGTDDEGCQAKFDKGNYGYTATNSNLKMMATGGDNKKELTYTRKGEYSCEFQDYLGGGHACADYYNTTIPAAACEGTLKGKLDMTRSCAERVAKTEKRICRYDEVSKGKDYNFVLTFYEKKVNCEDYKVSFLASFLD